MRIPLLLAAAALGAAPVAAAQDRAPRGVNVQGDDCAFLTKAFADTYRGIRAEEGKMENADPLNVIMYLNIQSNTVQLAEAAGCDVRPMIAIAKRQLRRYEAAPGARETGEGEPGEGYRGERRQ